MVDIAIGMTATPVPVSLLIPRKKNVEFAVRPVALVHENAISAVFAVIPNVPLVAAGVEIATWAVVVGIGMIVAPAPVTKLDVGAGNGEFHIWTADGDKE